MSIHIQDIYNYLDEHPIYAYNGSVTSMLGMIHDAYTMYNEIDSEEVKCRIRQIVEILGPLPAEKEDALFAVVCQLCAEHERLAFSHGIRLGMDLMMEVNWLP